MPFNPLGSEIPISLHGLQEEMNRLFSRLYHGGVSAGPFDGQEWAPAVDLLERDECYILQMEVPGVDVGEIDLSYQGGAITVRGNKRPPAEDQPKQRRLGGERRFGVFCRKVDLPADIDEDAISARCVSGVLEVTLPKARTSMAKEIKVEAGE